MPQREAKESYSAEIHCDPKTNKPTLKFPNKSVGKQISKFKQPLCPRNPFEPPDERKIVFGHKREDEIEQRISQYTPICTSCLKCNTSMQPLVAPPEARSAMYYICKYVSKHPYMLQRLVPLLAQAKIQIHKYGSKAADAGDPKRMAKHILQKLLN